MGKDRDKDESSVEERGRHRSKKKSKRKSKSSKHDRTSKSRSKSRKRHRSSSSSSESSSSPSENSHSSSSSSSNNKKNESRKTKKTVVVNNRLLAKLASRGETLDERKARRAQRKAVRIQATLGYTADDNPFNDPNLHETFTWKKRDLKMKKDNPNDLTKVESNTKDTFEEIEKVRKRRKDRELQFEELERIRAEEARMKELENYDEWSRKEEEFHLQQQRQRSAIRLVEGREKPIDVFAKNILLFGMSEDEKQSVAAVKYKEKYNALDAIGDLEAELEEPQVLLKMLKLNELEDLLLEIKAFQKLEHEASNPLPTDGHQRRETSSIILRYWDNLRQVAEDEVKYLKSGGAKGEHSTMVDDIKKIFDGNQSVSALMKMKDEIDTKLNRHESEASCFGADFDRKYWIFVREQLVVYLAKQDLSDLHSKMLVRQLEKLEMRKEQLSNLPRASVGEEDLEGKPFSSSKTNEDNSSSGNANFEFGDLEEELGLTSEHDLYNQGIVQKYSWQDKYRPRKPRYFNRVKTGYDWNKYNQTHYDKDNPPPKTVQGYKFNIFYPDLIDPTKTPQFKLEPSNSDDFCIIRFTAGPPYEDIAFKIVNREWNRSRKRGFKCTFERGVLSLYFNFTTHWYRK